jgi:hypothetical protein
VTFSGKNPNEGLLQSAVEKLAPLLGRIAFVGGSVTGLLVTDPGAAPVRATVDVDVIVAAASYGELIELEELLRKLGFRESFEEGAPRCRWINGDTILDFMPTDSAILGFSSQWYLPALQNAQSARVGNHEIRLITAPYFLATKLEAFRGRGNDDYRSSRDLEDIVTIIDGRPELGDEDPSCRSRLAEILSGRVREVTSKSKLSRRIARVSSARRCEPAASRSCAAENAATRSRS